jgi:hypothetical protein
VLSPRQKIEAQHDLFRLKRTSLDLKAAERRIWWDEQRYVKTLATKTAKTQEIQDIEYRAEQRRKAIAYDRQMEQMRKKEDHEGKLRAIQAIKTHKSALTEEETLKSTDDFQRTVRGNKAHKEPTDGENTGRNPLSTPRRAAREPGNAAGQGDC